MTMNKTIGIKEVIYRAARRVIQALAAVIWIGLLAGVAEAQSQPTLPAKMGTQPAGEGAYNYLYRAGLVCGAGASDSSVVMKPTAQCGGILSSFIPFVDLEAGVMGPQASQRAVSGYLSTNLVIPIFPLQDLGKAQGLPLVVGGYTRMFETGNAVDYGVAFTHPTDESHSVQFEVRDYWAFSNPSQHNVVIRVVWLVGVPD